jgi:hypothetical protein
MLSPQRRIEDEDENDDEDDRIMLPAVDGSDSLTSSPANERV